MTPKSNPAQSIRPERASFRKPQRISITMPEQPYRQLVERSIQQGRSISNLAAFLLETAIAELLEAEHNSRSINAVPKGSAAPGSSPAAGSPMRCCKDESWR